MSRIDEIAQDLLKRLREELEDKGKDEVLVVNYVDVMAEYRCGPATARAVLTRVVKVLQGEGRKAWVERGKLVVD